MKITPLYSRILVQEDEQPDTTESGIILSDKVDKERTVQAKVIEVGPGYREKDGSWRPTMVKKDDIIVYKRFVGDRIKIDGEELVLVAEEHVLCVCQTKSN